MNSPRVQWRKRISEDFIKVRLNAAARVLSTILLLEKDEVLAKFDAGEREHGDDPLTLDSEKEIRQEAMDIVCYAALED
jgi:hypothetical protein